MFKLVVLSKNDRIWIFYIVSFFLYEPNLQQVSQPYNCYVSMYLSSISNVNIDYVIMLLEHIFFCWSNLTGLQITKLLFGKSIKITRAFCSIRSYTDNIWFDRTVHIRFKVPNDSMNYMTRNKWKFKVYANLDIFVSG